MRLCMPPSSAVDVGVTRSVSALGSTEEQTQDSELRASRLRPSSSVSTDTRRNASDRYSYRAAISQQSDDWFACLLSIGRKLLIGRSRLPEAYTWLVRCAGYNNYLMTLSTLYDWFTFLSPFLSLCLRCVFVIFFFDFRYICHSFSGGLLYSQFMIQIVSASKTSPVSFFLKFVVGVFFDLMHVLQLHIVVKW